MVDLYDLGILLNQNMRDVESRIELLTEEVLPQDMTMVNETGRGENSFDAQMPSGTAMPIMQNQQPTRSLLRHLSIEAILSSSHFIHHRHVLRKNFFSKQLNSTFNIPYVLVQQDAQVIQINHG
ncbi:hypothetical protein ACSBR1_022846 [Camellia fascicularis]